MSTWDAWNYRRQETGSPTEDLDLVGYQVEATDGSIGTVDDATYVVGSSYVVVDTGPWIFGERVMLPAGTVDRLEVAEEKIHVDLTKEQIKNSPPFDPATAAAAGYRDELDTYYGGFYGSSF